MHARKVRHRRTSSTNAAIQKRVLWGKEHTIRRRIEMCFTLTVSLRRVSQSQPAERVFDSRSG